MARPEPANPAPALEPPRFDVLGVKVSALDMPLALQTIEQWVRHRQPNYVCVRDVHGVMASQRDKRLLQIHNDAGMVTPDGMPLVWLARLAGHHHVRRVYGPDLMHAVCHHSLQTGWKHFFYGGTEGVADQLRDRLTQRYPGLDVVGTHCPPFRHLTLKEDDDVTRHINSTGADIVWVGLSTPKQERWMNSHLGRLRAPVMIGVGAAFDFLAGRKRQAPRWMQRSGLEWSFRLCSEPKRLWRRYLTNNPAFVYMMARRMLRV